MATQTRGTPSGTVLADPKGVKVGIEDNLTLQCWEKDVTPPPVSLGEPIVLTNHHTVGRVPKKPNSIKDVGPLNLVCNYDPTVLNTLYALMGTTKWITISYPDGVTQDDRGWVNDVTPSNLPAAGSSEPPTIAIVIHFEGLDADDDELDPDWQESGGSDI